MHSLIEAWQEFYQTKAPPYLLDGDRHLSDQEDRVAQCKSYEEFVKSDDFGSQSTKFHLNLLPQPFIGNLEKASIFLLFLNPGFSPGDYYAVQHVPGYAAAIARNLTQTNGADPYPFFFLDPQLAWTAGGAWWQKKLRSIGEQLVEVAGCPGEFRLQEAFQLISQHLACVEMYPYHSQSFKQPKNLKSKELVCAYVKDVLVPKAEKGEALIVATRQVKAWPLPPSEHPNIIAFGGAQARGAHLTVDAEGKGGGAAILERLKPLLDTYQK